MKEQFKFSDLLLRKRIGLGETNIPHGFSLRALMIDVLDKLNLINDTGATCFKKWFTHFYSAVDKPNTCLRLWVSVSTFFKLYENPDYPSSSTTAEIISTNAPIGTQSVTQSLASCLLFCANISTEIDDFDRFIGDLPKITSARLLAQSGRCRVCRGKMHTCTAFHSESFDSSIPARILYWQRLKSLFSRLDISLGDKTKRPVFTTPLRGFYTTLKTALSAFFLKLLSLGWIRYETAAFA